MNLYTGRQARSHLSTNSLKWLWVACWGLSPQRQKSFIWQILCLLYRNCCFATILGILPTAFTLLSRQLCYLTIPYRVMQIVGSVVICLFSLPTFAGLSIQYVVGETEDQIMVKKENLPSDQITTIKLYTAHSRIDDKSGCIYNVGDVFLIDGGTATTTNSIQSQVNTGVEIPSFSIEGVVSGSKAISNSLQLPPGYYADISGLKKNPYWWINAIGLNKDGLIVENSGWGFGTTGTSICTYDVQKQCNFSDMNGLNEKQKSAILGLCGKEIISGYLDQNGHPDQSIKPDIPIKRSEFAKIIAKADGFKEDAKPNNLQKTSFFTDVPENQWYYKYVVYVYSKSFMQGNNNTREKFRPADEINRAEAIKTIYEMSKGKIMSYLDSSNCYLIKGGKLSCLSGSSVSLEGIGCPAFDTKWYCTSVSYLRAMDCLTDDYISSQEELFRSITRKEAFAILNCIITKTEG